MGTQKIDTKKLIGGRSDSGNPHGDVKGGKPATKSVKVEKATGTGNHKSVPDTSTRKKSEAKKG